MSRERSSSFAPIAHTWRALRHRNFKLFFFGQSVSLIGTWMTRLATAWLVYQLTHSALLLGVVSFSGQIVSFLLGPFAAVWVERLERRRLLVITQASAALQSLSLAVLTLTHLITLPEIIGLMMFQGLVNAFDMPGRQAFLVQMVDERADLANAIAINSSMVNIARLLGPALAGLLIAATSEGWCFLVDGVSYIAVIASLVAMRLPFEEPRPAEASMVTQLSEGWTYVSGSRPIRTILSLFALLSLMGWPFMVLMPVFAAQVLHGGPHTLGFLMGAVGVGSLSSALAMVARRSVRGLTKMIPLAALAFGIGLIAFGLSRSFWLSMLMMLLTGFGMMQGLTASNTIIQTLVDENMRGRVMSYYTMAFVGMAPFGSLLAGMLAQAIGAPHTVLVSGVACILGATWFWSQLPAVRREMRPIYERLGIIPQPNLALEENAEG